MADARGVVIIGGGHGAAQAATSLRAGGYGEPITIITDEPHPPYQRPPLSKAYLLGDLDADRLPLKPADFYESQSVSIMTDTLVSEIDLAERRVRVDRRGERSAHVDFAKLIIATGAEPVVPSLARDERDLTGWFTLRSRRDADEMADFMERHRRVAVVGGGYIGLEVAAAARKRDYPVTILEAAPRLLSRVSGPEIAAFFSRLHRERGVEIRTETPAFGLFGDMRVEAVRAGGGLERAERVPATMVVFGMGVRPRAGLAERAGLPCEDGIMTDEVGRTAHPDVFAVGDCARSWSPLYERPLRLESVQNAIDGAKATAAAILGVAPPKPQAPWNWSDQYDVKLQIAGVAEGADMRVIRGAPEDGGFAAFYLKDGVLIACDAVNAPAEFVVARQLITQRAKVAPARLSDTSAPIKSLLSTPAAPGPDTD